MIDKKKIIFFSLGLVILLGIFAIIYFTAPNDVDKEELDSRNLFKVYGGSLKKKDDKFVLKIGDFEYTLEEKSDKGKIERDKLSRVFVIDINAENMWLPSISGDNKVDLMIYNALNEVDNKAGGSFHTKYGEWYRLNDVPWCAIFISWCADKADILSEEEIYKFHYCPTAINYYKSIDKFGTVQEGYTPKAGDLFFLTTTGENGDGGDHTGIVICYEDGIVYSIEGNYGDAVKVVSRPIDMMYGFAKTGGTKTGIKPKRFVKGKDV